METKIVIPTKDKMFNMGPMLRPTPGNIITWILLAIGLVVTIVRFTQGIGSVSNLDDNQPWGIWIGFDLLCGVCLAAGGYFTTVACYVMGMKPFHSAARPAVLTAFLGDLFVVVALLYDLSHPLRLPYMFFFPGTTSVLFEVGLCVATYLTVLFLEFSVAPAEWLSKKFPFLLTYRHWIEKIGILLTIMGVCLSTLHQSSLGSLYLIAPGKLHPLWYSPFLPMFFFVSSMIAGASMVVFEGGNAPYLFSSYGAWWLVEMFGFVLTPAILYAKGSRDLNVPLCRAASAMAVCGIVLNRWTISMIAYNYQLPAAERYFPSLSEIMVSVFVVTMIVTAYRFICYHMPILYEHPDFKEDH